MPNLAFSYKVTNDLERFSDNVSRCLLSREASLLLQSLHLKIKFNVKDYMDYHIGILLGVAFGLQVRELKLQVSPRIFHSLRLFRVPRSLYNCQTLESLKLNQRILIDVPYPVCLKSLRTLHLMVSYKDDESVVNLLSGCSHLENLEVVQSTQPDVKIFTIDVPSLQRLIIKSIGEVVYVIKAPSLKYLKVARYIGFDSIMIGNTPELEEADINTYSKIYDYTLGSLTSVKRLCLVSHSSITYPTGTIFYRLVYLKLPSRTDDWLNLLMFMLNASPKLQVLKLTCQDWSQNEKDGVKVKWSQPKNVPECLLLHLETFVWKGYKQLLEEEKEVVKYTLLNAKRLKRATFSIKGLNSDERIKMVKKLESLVRASKSSCQLRLLE
ncbi:unnamed protein product [Microthlaspi erraticum]|uniref:FBD domain-containing protein n=1 Tax=Microthlaspi erraticum TaxID=1685480 RepID=A0A6D2JIZ3_9BRAS|nr:unnamed protein product [Microthlaspi erraticum]CAA7042396.1 unnamed protein product [Microthlaspi erraticum]CAA7046505.1 unnamed protein product [Microthlaspi erraticum]